MPIVKTAEKDLPQFLFLHPPPSCRDITRRGRCCFNFLSNDSKIFAGMQGQRFSSHGLPYFQEIVSFR
jgi:hypothetical protein